MARLFNFSKWRGVNNEMKTRRTGKTDQSAALRTLTPGAIRRALGPNPYQLIWCPWGVYKGRMAGTPVIIHVLKPDQNVVEIARLMHKFSHRHVARFIGWCKESRSIVVEGGTGRSLKERVKEKGLSWQECCRIAEEVASAALFFSNQNIPVEIECEYVFFDEQDNSRLIYVPQKTISLTRDIGRMLIKMSTGKLRDCELGSPSLLKENLDPRSGNWPEDLIGEFVDVTTSCYVTESPASVKEIALEISYVSGLAVDFDKKLNRPASPSTPVVEKKVDDSSTFADDIWIVTAEQIDRATNSFSPDNKIGAGGFGEVYKGRLDGMELAIKKLRRGKVTKRFRREIQLLNGLRHPHVLSLIGFDPTGPCLVCEYMAGGSLQDWLQEKRGILTWEDKVRISREMASAVLHMHSRQMLHRDLKPANVLLDRHKRSKICDMGLAKLCHAEQVAMSTMQGTRGYIDPYTLSNRSVGPHSDTYALGLIILQLFTGMWRIQDLHSLLTQYERQSDSASRLIMESQYEDSTFLEDSNLDSGISSKAIVSFYTPSLRSHSVSRWEEGPRSFNELVDCFCEHLEPRSAAMPREALWKIVGLLLRCVERTWDRRPTLEDLLPALEELEAIVTKGGHQQADFGTFVDPCVDSEGAFQFAERERVAGERVKEIMKKIGPLRSALEALIISREKLQKDTVVFKEKSESEMRLSRLQSDISMAANPGDFKEATRLWEEVQLLMDVMASAAERRKNKNSELEYVEIEIAKKKARLALVEEELAESERALAVARCQRLRVVARAAKWEKKAAAERDDFWEAAFLFEKANAADKEADDLQITYGLEGRQFER